MDKLKPCKCGSTKLWIVKINPLQVIFKKYCVECCICHYCGETKIGKKRAIKAWNKCYEYGVENVMAG